MPKRRSTIGGNPLDELGALKGRGRRAHVASADPAVTTDIRAMLSKRPASASLTSLFSRLGRALSRLNPFS